MKSVKSWDVSLTAYPALSEREGARLASDVRVLIYVRRTVNGVHLRGCDIVEVRIVCALRLPQDYIYQFNS